MSVKRSHSSDDTPIINNKLHKKLKKSDQPLDDLSEVGQLTQEDVIYYQKEAIYRLLNLFRSKNKRLKKDLKLVTDNYNTIHSQFLVLNNWWFQIVENFKNFDQITSSSEDEINEKLLIHIQANDEKSLKELRNKLIKLIQPLLSITPSNKEDKLINLEESLTNLNLFKDQLQDENKLLKEKLEELNQELDQFIEQKDRADSITLNRISEVKKKDKEDTPLENGRSNSPNGGASGVGPNGENINFVEVENLKIEVSELKTKNSELTTQLTEKLNSIHKLETQVLSLENNLADLTEDDLLKCSIYQSLVKKNSDLSSEIGKLKYEASRVQAQFLEMESKQTKNESLLKDKLSEEINSNNAYVSKLENDLNRIRSDRDELQSRLSILKAEKGKTDLTDEYRKFNELLEKRVGELEAKVSGNLTIDDNSESNSPRDVETLIKHNKLLSLELKQLEEAFKSTRDIANSKLSKYAESESYMNKLTIEKSKADQKYFQAMRSKDSLTSQNKVLNSNLSKQSELIEILKTNEKNLVKKLEVEDELFQKLKDLESVKKNDLSFQISRNKELEIKLKALQDSNSNLQSKLLKKQEVITSQSSKLITLETDLSSQSSKIQSLEKLLNKYRANPAGVKSEEDDEINQALLNMTKCSLCNKNFKSCTLKGCGHCFCDDCIKDRLSSRMRKCPTCNYPFSAYDLLVIHL